MLGYVIHDVGKGVNVHIPYPAESDALKGGCGFHHGRFIMALRKAAQAEPKYGLLLITQHSLLLSDHDDASLHYELLSPVITMPLP